MGGAVVATTDSDLGPDVARAALELRGGVEPALDEVRVPLQSGTAVFTPLRVDDDRVVGWLGRVEGLAGSVVDGRRQRPK